MKTAYYNLLYDVLRGYDRCTPSKIVSLRNNQIFVFGTNKYGSRYDILSPIYNLSKSSSSSKSLS